MSFCLVRAMEYAKFALIIQKIRTEEMLVIFDFFFKFLGMNFSAVNYKSPQEFCSGHQEHLNSFFSVVFFCHAHIIWWVGCSVETIQLFKKFETRRLQKEINGIINPSFNGWTYNMCGHFDLPFPTSKCSSKNFFKSTTFKFWNFPVVHILERK